jgi:hypothetical protein
MANLFRSQIFRDLQAVGASQAFDNFRDSDPAPLEEVTRTHHAIETFGISVGALINWWTTHGPGSRPRPVPDPVPPTNQTFTQTLNSFPIDVDDDTDSELGEVVHRISIPWIRIGMMLGSVLAPYIIGIIFKRGGLDKGTTTVNVNINDERTQFLAFSVNSAKALQLIFKQLQ